MVEIVRDHDEWGEDLVWWVEWETNDHDFCERYFKSRRQAERFALKIEEELLIEAVTQFTGAWARMSPDQRRACNAMVERGGQQERGSSKADGAASSSKGTTGGRD